MGSSDLNAGRSREKCGLCKDMADSGERTGKRRGSVAKPKGTTYLGMQGLTEKERGFHFYGSCGGTSANTFRDDLPPIPLVDFAVRLFPTLSKEQMESTHNRRIS